MPYLLYAITADFTDHISMAARAFLVTTPLAPWVLLTIGFYVLESAAATPDGARATGQENWRSRAGNIACGFLLCITVFLYTPAILRITERVTGGAPGLFRIPGVPGHPLLSAALAVFIILLVTDFFFYIWHRAEHRWRFLWDIHAVHHSEAHFNSTTYMRQSWMDGLLQGLFVTLPTLLLLNVAPEERYIAYIMSMGWDFFAHADLRLELGPLAPILTGPQLHRLHHSRRREHHDSNFAQFFPIWDILFGTYVAPKRGEFPDTGISYGERIETLPHMVMWPLQQWARKLRRLAARG